MLQFSLIFWSYVMCSHGWLQIFSYIVVLHLLKCDVQKKKEMIDFLCYAYFNFLLVFN